jgi:hypothetical protein
MTSKPGEIQVYTAVVEKRAVSQIYHSLPNNCMLAKCGTKSSRFYIWKESTIFI